MKNKVVMGYCAPPDKDTLAMAYGYEGTAYDSLKQFDKAGLVALHAKSRFLWSLRSFGMTIR